MADLKKGAFGFGKFGGDAEAFFGAAAPLALSFAYATSETSLRIGLTREPQNLTPYLEGDVYTPLTWRVTRLDTGQDLIVIGVRRFDHPLVWDLFTLRRLGVVAVRHRVSSTTLRTRSGIRIAAPNRIDFAGTKNTNALDPLPRYQGVVDIRNRSLEEGPTIQIGGRGLYEVEAKIEALKKRLKRMLITAPGTLPGDDTFGIGFKEKEPLPIGDITALQRRIEEGFLRDPEVRSAAVELETDDESGIVYIRARVLASFTDEPVSADYALPGVLV